MELSPIFSGLFAHTAKKRGQQPARLKSIPDEYAFITHRLQSPFFAQEFLLGCGQRPRLLYFSRRELGIHYSGLNLDSGLFRVVQYCSLIQTDTREVPDEA